MPHLRLGLLVPARMASMLRNGPLTYTAVGFPLTRPFLRTLLALPALLILRTGFENFAGLVVALRLQCRLGVRKSDPVLLGSHFMSLQPPPISLRILLAALALLPRASSRFLS
jgi:hypothetical protein